MSDNHIALVERSYLDDDSYLQWIPVAVFPDVDRALAWSRDHQHKEYPWRRGEGIKCVILLERPHPIVDTGLANFVDNDGICRLIDWKAGTCSSLEVTLPDRPRAIEYQEIFRIRLCAFGELEEFEYKYQRSE